MSSGEDAETVRLFGDIQSPTAKNHYALCEIQSLTMAAQIVRCPQLNPLSARAQTIRSCLQRVARYPAALQKQRAGSGRQIPPHASRSRIREDALSS